MWGAGCLAEDVGSWLASWLAEVTAGEESGGLEADRTSTPSDLPSKNQKNQENLKKKHYNAMFYKVLMFFCDFSGFPGKQKPGKSGKKI